MSFFGGEVTNVGPVLSGFDVTEPFGSAAGATYEIQLLENPVTAANRQRDRALLDYDPETLILTPEGDPYQVAPWSKRRPAVEKEEVMGMASAVGVDAGRVPFIAGHSREYWQSIVDGLKVKTEYENRIQRAEKSVSFYAASLGTGAAAMVQDPLNVATMFVPVVGQTRYAAMIARASSLGGRVGIRAGVGAAEGALGAALAEPFVYSAISQEDADYTMTDSLMNLAMGATFGAALNPLISPIMERNIRKAAALGDVDGVMKVIDEVVEEQRGIRARAQEQVDSLATRSGFARAEQPQLKTAMAMKMEQASAQTREVVFRAAVNQLMRGEPVNITGILDSDIRVRDFVNGFRTTDSQQVMHDLITDATEDWALQFDVSDRLTAPERKVVAEQMDSLKRRMAAIAERRETLREQGIGAKGSLKQQMVQVKKDKTMVDELRQVEAELKNLEGVLSKSRVSKEARAEMNRMAERIRSGELMEEAFTRADEMRNLLKHLAPDDKSDIVGPLPQGDLFGDIRAMRAVNDEFREVQLGRAGNDDALLTAEIDELGTVLDAELNEVEFASLTRTSKAVDQDVSTIGTLVDELRACRAS